MESNSKPELEIYTKEEIKWRELGARLKEEITAAEFSIVVNKELLKIADGRIKKERSRRTKKAKKGKRTYVS